jgi:hypothetical protein
MKSIKDISDLRLLLCGILTTTSTTATTCYSYPIDTLGFEEVMAIVTMGSLWSTASQNADVYVKFQEGSVAQGTGGAWSDITDGYPCGSFDVGAIATSTPGAVASQKVGYWGREYMQLGSDKRKRYLRAVASVTGTIGNGPLFVPISVAVLLGHAISTDYIANASSATTSLTEVFTISRYGSIWGTLVNAL